jgi:hypothetical protein
MSHQVHFHKRDGKWFYDAPGDENLSTAISATRSIRMIAEYFQPGREILLPVGVFKVDGGTNAAGINEASKFSHATGDVYRAKMLEFDIASGRLLCEVTERFSIR